MTYSPKILHRGLATVAAACCGLVLFFTPLSPVPAQSANAQWAVAVIEEQPITLARMADALAWQAAKTVVQSMTQSIVNWINSGFDGSPAFVTDLGRNLGSLADAVAEDFFRQLDATVYSNTGFSVRAPFQDQISAALREEFYRTTSSYGFDARHPYQDCYQGGGFSFDGWFCESQNPANNPWGRYLLARQELWTQIDAESRYRLAELEWGQGFLSWRGSCGPYGTNAQAGGDVDLNQRDTTAGCSIRTPGSVVEEQIVGALGSPLRQLELADSIDEIVGSLMSQLVGQVLGGGGLSGVSQPSSGGGSSFLDRATNAAANLDTAFMQQLARVESEASQYRSAWQRIASAASSARQACAGTPEEARAAQVFASASANATASATLVTNLNTVKQRAAALRTSPTATNDDVLDVIGQYRSLLSEAGTLSAGPFESQDTGDSEPASLYSQMVRLERSCR